MANGSEALMLSVCVFIDVVVFVQLFEKKVSVSVVLNDRLLKYMKIYMYYKRRSKLRSYRTT